jgi:hypothetical protein
LECVNLLAENVLECVALRQFFGQTLKFQTKVENEEENVLKNPIINGVKSTIFSSLLILKSLLHPYKVR